MYDLAYFRLSSPGRNIKFMDEVESVKKEAARLKAAGINKIIAVGHAGIDVDINIATNVEDVDVVVGGHTNTFLYNGAYKCMSLAWIGDCQYSMYRVSTKENLKSNHFLACCKSWMKNNFVLLKGLVTGNFITKCLEKSFMNE